MRSPRERPGFVEAPWWWRTWWPPMRSRGARTSSASPRRGRRRGTCKPLLEALAADVRETGGRVRRSLRARRTRCKRRRRWFRPSRRTRSTGHPARQTGSGRGPGAWGRARGRRACWTPLRRRVFRGVHLRDVHGRAVGGAYGGRRRRPHSPAGRIGPTPGGAACRHRRLRHGAGGARARVRRRGPARATGWTGRAPSRRTPTRATASATTRKTARAPAAATTATTSAGSPALPPRRSAGKAGMNDLLPASCGCARAPAARTARRGARTCGADDLVVARAALHSGRSPPSAEGGQWHGVLRALPPALSIARTRLAQGRAGRPVSVERLAECAWSWPGRAR